MALDVSANNVTRKRLVVPADDDEYDDMMKV
jgi:hypothetical protein